MALRYVTSMTTDTLRLIDNHRSDRSFTDQPVDDALLDEILRACQWAPTSGNTQHVSVVVIKDPAKKAKMAELAGGQPWIARAPVFLVLLADQYKTAQAMELAGRQHVIQEYVEGTISTVTDVGILLGQLMVAAHARGLGIVPIGAVRNEADQVIDLLNLPPLTFPVVGLCLGYVKNPSHQRPRLPHETFRFDESYGTPDMKDAITAYDQALLDHWKKVGRENGEAWSKSISHYSDHNYRPRLMAALKRQGFRFDRE